MRKYQSTELEDWLKEIDSLCKPTDFIAAMNQASARDAETRPIFEKIKSYYLPGYRPGVRMPGGERIASGDRYLYIEVYETVLAALMRGLPGMLDASQAEAKKDESLKNIGTLVGKVAPIISRVTVGLSSSTTPMQIRNAATTVKIWMRLIAPIAGEAVLPVWFSNTAATVRVRKQFVSCTFHKSGLKIASVAVRLGLLTRLSLPPSRSWHAA